MIVGLKLFNSLDDDTFQLAMLAEVHGESRPDFLIYANRLFDPDRVFEGQRGVAYGGPDLSDRNLRLLSTLRAAQERGEIPRRPMEISATGDISSGRIAVEYALRGCTSFQIHTLFQLPSGEYPMRVGTKVQRALHRLYFDPEDGFIVWLIHAARRLDLAREGLIRFLDLARIGASQAANPSGPRRRVALDRQSVWACRCSGWTSVPPAAHPRRSRAIIDEDARGRGDARGVDARVIEGLRGLHVADLVGEDQLVEMGEGRRELSAKESRVQDVRIRAQEQGIAPPLEKLDQARDRLVEPEDVLPSADELIVVDLQPGELTEA